MTDPSSHLTPSDQPTLRREGSVPSSQPVLPEVFGRYRIVKVLGQGGMGTVYLAHDTQLERPVALKAPHFEEGGSQGSIDRFLREAKVAAGFNHPSLCPVYDSGQVNGVYYLTMPYLQGESLSARLKREGKLSPQAAVEMAARIARGLEAAHQAGVIHRDLKPANVMLREDGSPVVMDFGLARRGAAKDSMTTSPGTIIGTPAYLAPEQIGADPESLGPACDVYSLGVVLFEMLTGQVPFQGELHQVLRKVLAEVPPPPSHLAPQVPPRLDVICRKALEKEPRDRFASMAEFASALETHGRWQAGAEGRRRWLRRVAAVALLVTIACWVSWFLKGDPLPVGSRWYGSFSFRPPGGPYTGDVEVEVVWREGKRFRGTYATESRQYEWEIEGRLSGEHINWEFTKAIKDNPEHSVVGKADVDGAVMGDTMVVQFRQPAENMIADMQLHRVP